MPTAEEIVQRYVKARGGMQRIMAISNAHSSRGRWRR
jgi:alkyl sulfatase BDS1-like metallo-beta-lactamase superfamily hydrolase